MAETGIGRKEQCRDGVLFCSLSLVFFACSRLRVYELWFFMMPPCIVVCSLCTCHFADLLRSRLKRALCHLLTYSWRVLTSAPQPASVSFVPSQFQWQCSQRLTTTCRHHIVVPYELYELYGWEKFRNFKELYEFYEFYVLLDNLSALYSWACSTHVPALATLSE